MPTKKRTAKKGGAKKRTAKKSTARRGAAKKGGARKAATKRSTRTARKSASRTSRAAKPKTKRAPNPAFMRPLSVSPELGMVVGTSPLPRTEVTKKLWAYIRNNRLQDQTNRRMINADEKLRAVFGGRNKVSMFEMTKLVSKHLK